MTTPNPNLSETHAALIERLAKPIGMQDVRLAAGEGKLSNADVLRAVNAIVSVRAGHAAQAIRDLEAKVAGAAQAINGLLDHSGDRGTFEASRHRAAVETAESFLAALQSNEGGA